MSGGMAPPIPGQGGAERDSKRSIVQAGQCSVLVLVPGASGVRSSRGSCRGPHLRLCRPQPPLQPLPLPPQRLHFPQSQAKVSGKPPGRSLRLQGTV